MGHGPVLLKTDGKINQLGLERPDRASRTCACAASIGQIALKMGRYIASFSQSVYTKLELSYQLRNPSGKCFVAPYEKPTMPSV